MRNCLISFDAFNIANRLKQIDKRYFIVFDTKSQKYQIHYKRNCNTLELVLPFDKLDARTIDYVRKTRIENRKKLIEEMEKSNAKLEREKTNKILDEASYKALEVYKYKANSTIKSEQFFKDKWF